MNDGVTRDRHETDGTSYSCNGASMLVARDETRSLLKHSDPSSSEVELNRIEDPGSKASKRDYSLEYTVQILRRAPCKDSNRRL